eukprot:TRINITY_DN41141_c0_g1_i1.p1 TRINITY_DN41141_c0_g1~~TRINITY_DN41141_c0_g1_i1.p1  ORF type:complete len:458 (-),score=44.32 TRINITY_DN41141_c0_g1_i1:461-1834(-)
MSSVQQTENFLSVRLSNRGGPPLPYSEQNKPTIRAHLVDLSRQFPSLGVQESPYTYNDGTTFQLIKIKGTLPMYYMSKKFNIPIEMYLPVNYPVAAPIVYVVPTSDMVIKQGHSVVDANGLVNTQFMRNWSRQRSDLLGLCQDMSICFGQEPPVYAKPPNFQPQQQHPPPPPPGARQGYPYPYTNQGPPRPFGGPPVGQGPGYGHGYPPPVGHPQNGPHTQQYPGQQTVHQPPAQQPPDLDKQFRQLAEASLSKRLQETIQLRLESNRDEMIKLCEKQSLLESRSKEIAEGLNTYQQEKEGLESSVNIMSGLVGQLDAWLQIHEPRQASLNMGKSEEDQIDPDVAIVAVDATSQQALNCQSKDMAIEDCLLALDKGLQKGIIDINSYLKQVRVLSRKQFFSRALAIKVANVQQRQPPPPPGQPRAMAMATGDSWVNVSVLQPPNINMGQPVSRMHRA